MGFRSLDSQGRLKGVGATGPTGPAGADGANPGFDWAGIATAETQAAGSGSSGWSDLATVGPSVTIDMAGTIAVVEVRGIVTKSGSGFTGFLAVAVSGATTINPANPNPVYPSNGGDNGLGIVGPGGLVWGMYFLTGLTPGSNTFKMVYHNDGGATWTFSERVLKVFAK